MTDDDNVNVELLFSHCLRRQRGVGEEEGEEGGEAGEGKIVSKQFLRTKGVRRRGERRREGTRQGALCATLWRW